jgi:hypothetical protein
VDAEGLPATELELTLPADDRRWTTGWRQRVLAIVFLAYLVYVGKAVAQNSPRHTLPGYVILGVFVAAYLAIVLLECPGTFL